MRQVFHAGWPFPDVRVPVETEIVREFEFDHQRRARLIQLDFTRETVGNSCNMVLRSLVCRLQLQLVLKRGKKVFVGVGGGTGHVSDIILYVLVLLATLPVATVATGTTTRTCVGCVSARICVKSILGVVIKMGNNDASRAFACR